MPRLRMRGAIPPFPQYTVVLYVVNYRDFTFYGTKFLFKFFLVTNEIVYSYTDSVMDRVSGLPYSYTSDYRWQ
jgi:hypothetical protein